LLPPQDDAEQRIIATAVMVNVDSSQHLSHSEKTFPEKHFIEQLTSSLWNPIALYGGSIKHFDRF
jgi:hypothetical protein